MLQENFDKALKAVKDGCPERYSTLPIMKDVLFSVEGGMITLTTGDLESVIQYTFGCKLIDEPFSFTIPCKFTAEMVSLLPNDVIELNYNGDRATFKCGRYTANINTKKSEDYPPTPKTEGQEFEIYDLADAIKKVKDLIENERYGYSKTDGLLFDMSLCQIVATDLKRMKVAHINAQPIDLKFRISKKASAMLLKCKDTVKVTYQPPDGDNRNSHIRFESGKTTIITQNLEGNHKYPDYMKAVNDDKYKEYVEVF
jgi:DNA polymerase III sliding clamp (beta) subunit (PCNA family)